MLRVVLVSVALLFATLSSSFAADTGISVASNVSYGALPSQKLDIYSPRNVTAETPVLVFFYGGGWSLGDKADLARQAKSFAGNGVIFVAPNYRLHTAFPAFVEDSALATSFVWNKLRTADGTPRKLFVGGWSAGAYNAAMVALNQSFLEADGTPASAVAGLIGLSGPYDGGRCMGFRCMAIFPQSLQSRWVIAGYVDSSAPPMLLIGAGYDEYVAKGNMEGLVKAADRAAVPVTSFLLPEGSHRTPLTDLLKTDSRVRKSVDAFIRDTPKR